MKIASRATSIGDKLYNLERIHSKLFHYYSVCRRSNIPNFENDINNALESLYHTVICFSDNAKTRNAENYYNSIKSLIAKKKNARENYLDVWDNLKYCHSSFIKYRKEQKRHILKGCEIDFQNVCFHLYRIENHIKNEY